MTAEETVEPHVSSHFHHSPNALDQTIPMFWPESESYHDYEFQIQNELQFWLAYWLCPTIIAHLESCQRLTSDKTPSAKDDLQTDHVKELQ